jgi:hypothetical protein
MGVFSVELDTTDANGQILITNLATYFRYVDAIVVGDNDTLADNGYKYQALCPARTVAVSASNIIVTVHQSAGAASAMAAVASTDLSAVGALKLVVYGRKTL